MFFTAHENQLNAQRLSPVHRDVCGNKAGFPVVKLSQPALDIQAALGGILSLPHFLCQDLVHFLKPLLPPAVRLIISLDRLPIAPGQL